MCVESLSYNLVFLLESNPALKTSKEGVALSHQSDFCQSTGWDPWSVTLFESFNGGDRISDSYFNF